MECANCGRTLRPNVTACLQCGWRATDPSGAEDGAPPFDARSFGGASAAAAAKRTASGMEHTIFLGFSLVAAGLVAYMKHSHETDDVAFSRAMGTASGLVLLLLGPPYLVSMVAKGNLRLAIRIAAFCAVAWFHGRGAYLIRERATAQANFAAESDAIVARMERDLDAIRAAPAAPAPVSPAATSPPPRASSPSRRPPQDPELDAARTNAAISAPQGPDAGPGASAPQAQDDWARIAEQEDAALGLAEASLGEMRRSAEKLDDRSKEVVGALLDVNERLFELVRGYQAAAGAFVDAGAANPEGIRTREDLASRMRAAEAFVGANKDLASFWDKIDSRLESALAGLDLSARERSEIVRSYKTGADEGRDRTSQKLDLALGSDALAVLKLLKREWGKWRSGPDGVTFDRDAAVDEYNVLIARIAATAAEQISHQAP